MSAFQKCRIFRRL